MAEDEVPAEKPEESTGDAGKGSEGGAQVGLTPAKPQDPSYSPGKPSKLPKEKLMASEGIIRIQSGSNKYASQRGITGFGRPRDVIDKVVANNLKALEDPAKICKLKETLRLQMGSNKFASQKGQTGNKESIIYNN